jgi:hypothetical protein
MDIEHPSRSSRLDELSYNFLVFLERRGSVSSSAYNWSFKIPPFKGTIQGKTVTEMMTLLYQGRYFTLKHVFDWNPDLENHIYDTDIYEKIFESVMRSGKIYYLIKIT